MRLSTNADEILRRMRARPQAATRELSEAAKRGAVVLNRTSKHLLRDRIYSVEIPFRKTVSERIKRRYAGTSRQRVGGQRIRLWERTGALLRAERGGSEGPVIVLSNNMEYAMARYLLGTPEGRKIKTPGVQSVQWHAEAIAKERPVILRLRREAILAALRQP